MAAFQLEQFAKQLIAEALFFDEEYGVFANLSLIDPESARERFIASFSPEEGLFVIEEATEWEDLDGEESEDGEYAMAVDTREYSTHEDLDEVATALLNLARTHNLEPSITLVFDEDEV
jgi:hypothetical protein